MSRFILQLLFFVVVLIVLNFLFGDYGLHISIIGSLVLTIVLSLVFGMFQSGRR